MLEIEQRMEVSQSHAKTCLQDDGQEDSCSTLEEVGENFFFFLVCPAYLCCMQFSRQLIFGLFVRTLLICSSEYRKWNPGS